MLNFLIKENYKFVTIDKIKNIQSLSKNFVVTG